MPDIIVLTLRAASYVAGLQAAGIVIFLTLFRKSLVQSAHRVHSLGLVSVTAGLLLTLGHHFSEPARLAGSLCGIFDPSMHAMLLAANVSAAGAVRVLGLIFVLLGLRSVHRHGSVPGLIGATLVACSFALTGHTAAHDLRWLLIAILLIHLLIVIFWFGALLPLVVASRREDVADASAVIDAFSTLATKLVPVIFLAGLVMSILLLAELRNLWTPYGISLILKVAGFAALMGLAALNKWRLTPAIGAGDGTALTAFRRSALMEWCIMIAVISVTAVMTGLFSPTG